jgi:hypothetical protein
LNYLDYVEIMQAEKLRLPEVGKYTIDEAIRCQKVIKALANETSFDMTKQIKQMEERKIENILLAIEWARLAKAEPIAFKWADKQLNRKRGLLL